MGKEVAEEAWGDVSLSLDLQTSLFLLDVAHCRFFMTIFVYSQLSIIIFTIMAKIFKQHYRRQGFISRWRFDSTKSGPLNNNIGDLYWSTINNSTIYLNPDMPLNRNADRKN